MHPQIPQSKHDQHHMKSIDGWSHHTHLKTYIVYYKNDDRHNLPS